MTTFTTQDRQDAQRQQPLHEDLIYGWAYKHGIERGDVIEFARAIERAHGIVE